MTDRGTRQAGKRRDSFHERYARGRLDVHLQVELEVIGAAFGANGYTTLAQAHELFDVLKGGPGTRILDVGSGRGWPGLYLSEESGVEAILTDVPEPAVRAALRNVDSRGLTGRCAVVRATGTELPFRSSTFDTVVHTDVL